MESFNLPVSMLRQYSFCPRIPFLYLAREIDPPKGTWVKQGMSYHQIQEILSKRRNLSRFGLTGEFKLSSEVRLYSERLKLHGICDGIIETNDTLFPLEYKLQEKLTKSTGAVIQLVAYAMLIEEKYNKKISCGFILYGSKGKTHEVLIDSITRKQVTTIINRIEQDCSMGLLPNTSASERQCSQCEFSNFCADRL